MIKFGDITAVTPLGNTARPPKVTKPMDNARRIRAYARTNGQTGRFRPTPAQRRRINKHHRREWEF